MNITTVNFTARNPLNAKNEEEMRAKLSKAADDAKLNVTERLALNDEFFPYGGGFELFPQDVAVHRINTFFSDEQNKDLYDACDNFTAEVRDLEIPEHVSRVERRMYRSSKSNFQANFDNAVSKLKKVLNPGGKKEQV